MQVHNLVQGSPEWHAYRRNHFNASDAPAMMSCSPYKTRDQLIAELATGIAPEVDSATQAIFDTGHRSEKLALPLAEQIVGEELAPLVGSEGKFSASFDGLTLMEDTGFEHKSLNKALREAMFEGCTGADLPLVYRVQMEQQCMVAGCTRVLFVASKWDGDTLVEERHCWYEPDAALRAEIVAGWAQLEKDVAAYQAPDEAPAKVVAEVVTALPAVFAQVSGQIALKDNLPEFEVALRDFIENRLIRQPESDQDFANLDLQIRALKGAEAALDASEEQALSQAEMLSAFKRQKDMLHKLTRQTRLDAEKLLAAEKERIKHVQVQRGQQAFAKHIADLNTRLGKPYMPTVHTDFAGAIKGKRTVDSLRSAINDELARAKMAASEIADRIQLNLATLREQASAHAFLFADAAQIVLKQPDDLAVLVKSRIGEHQAKEAARLEAERDRIRKEEAERADREARERLEQQERDRQAEIAQARKDEALPAPVLDDLAEVATHVRDQGVADIGARQAIAAAQASAPAAPVAPVHRPTAPAAEAEAADLRIGAINERLGFTVNADFLLQLGFSPAPGKGSHRFYRESQFPAMCRAISAHALQQADKYLPATQTA